MGQILKHVVLDIHLSFNRSLSTLSPHISLRRVNLGDHWEQRLLSCSRVELRVGTHDFSEHLITDFFPSIFVSSHFLLVLHVKILFILFLLSQFFFFLLWLVETKLLHSPSVEDIWLFLFVRYWSLRNVLLLGYDVIWRGSLIWLSTRRKWCWLVWLAYKRTLRSIRLLILVLFCQKLLVLLLSLLLFVISSELHYIIHSCGNYPTFTLRFHLLFVEIDALI